MISIIIPTIGHCISKTKSLVEALAVHDGVNEILIVNQSKAVVLDGSIRAIDKAKEFHVDFRGASKARNYGARIARSKYVAFLDDDVSLDLSHLEKAVSFLESNNSLCGLSGIIKSNVGNIKNRTQLMLTKKNMAGNYIESALVFRSEVFNRFLFDETLGAGVFHSSFEAHDLIHRILSDGNTFVFYPEYVVIHDDLEISNYQARMRYFSHGLGIGGYFLKSHDYELLLKEIIRALGGSLVYALKFQLNSRYLAKICGIISALVIGRKT